MQLGAATLSKLMPLSDRVIVMVEGKKLVEGSPKEAPTSALLPRIWGRNSLLASGELSSTPVSQQSLLRVKRLFSSFARLGFVGEVEAFVKRPF